LVALKPYPANHLYKQKKAPEKSRPAHAEVLGVSAMMTQRGAAVQVDGAEVLAVLGEKVAPVESECKSVSHCS
jgi:hypothetical protein